REHHGGVVREQPAHVARGPGLGHGRHLPLFPFCRSARPPAIITSTISTPWITCAQFWSTPLMISTVFPSVSTNPAAIGTASPPTPPSSDTPPSTTAATEFSV